MGQDDFGRTIGVCSAPGLELNRAMVKQGWATAFRKYSEVYTSYEDRAKAARLGIWNSDVVSPAEYRASQAPRKPRPLVQPARPVHSYGARPPPASGCLVKGNHSRRGDWIYHLPGMPYYEQTRAEQMFCTEQEAIAAGYRRSRAGP